MFGLVITMEPKKGGKKENVAEPSFTAATSLPKKPTVESESPNTDAEEALEPPSPQDSISGEDSIAVTSSKSESSIDFQEKNCPLQSSRRLARSASVHQADQKKIVRFADTMGLQLEEIKSYKRGIFRVPDSAFSDLQLQSEPKSPPVSSSPQKDVETKLMFVPQFQQPGSDAYFLNKLHEQKVCLENLIVSDDSVSGIIRTVNMGFEKLVEVRYTTDKWASYEDIPANYLPSGSDGFSDRFSFNIRLPSKLLNNKLIFSIRYVVNGQEFWDNNYSDDFVVKCVAQRVIT